MNELEEMIKQLRKAYRNDELIIGIIERLYQELKELIERIEGTRELSRD